MGDKYSVRIYRKDKSSFLSVVPDGSFRPLVFNTKNDAEKHAKERQGQFPGQKIIVESY